MRTPALSPTELRVRVTAPAPHFGLTYIGYDRASRTYIIREIGWPHARLKAGERKP